MMGLTAGQQRLLSFIESHISEHDIAPSYADMADHLGFASSSTVHRMVDCIIERGALRKIPKRPRALEICRGFVVEPIPEVRLAIEKFAAEQHITVKTAAEEALRAYFVGGAP